MLEASRYQAKLARRQHDAGLGAADFQPALQNGDDLHHAGVDGNIGGSTSPASFDNKQRVTRQRAHLSRATGELALNERRLEVVEVNARQRLRDVQFARL